MLKPEIFKAYDIRGVVGKDFDEAGFYRIGQAYGAVLAPRGEVVVGRDVRLHSKKLQKSLIRGLQDAGINVVDIGEVSTDMFYFAVGYFQFAGGLMVTASHNPKEYNGIKLVREQVVPISGDDFLPKIRDWALSQKKLKSLKKGGLRKLDVWQDYAKFHIRFINLSTLRAFFGQGKTLILEKPYPKKTRFRLTLNPNFGLMGKIALQVFNTAGLALEIVPLNFWPDGSFPKGRPDPFVPENRPEFLEIVQESCSDLGAAWDADGDRIFFAREDAIFVEPYYTNTLFIKQILKKHPGEKIIYDPRYTWALIDTIKEAGGIPILERVGHSFIKARMRKEKAVFAGESSGHTFFRDFYYADNGILPLLLLLEFLAESRQSFKSAVSQVMAKYPISGEINLRLENKELAFKKLKERFVGKGVFSEFDGLSFECKRDWRFNIRPSNTEPLLRINVEAKTLSLVQEKTKELLSLLKE
jgi:phosphomannomutase/phosphomannomutase/phosphoglucomutase